MSKRRAGWIRNGAAGDFLFSFMHYDGQIVYETPYAVADYQVLAGGAAGAWAAIACEKIIPPGVDLCDALIRTSATGISHTRARNTGNAALLRVFGTQGGRPNGTQSTTVRVALDQAQYLDYMNDNGTVTVIDIAGYRELRSP